MNSTSTSEISIEDLKELNKNDYEFSQKCSKIAENINTCSVPILHLIEVLGTLLSDPAPGKREFGVEILVKVLRNVNRDLLSSQQISVIAGFFCDKLKDHHQVVIPALNGILVILEFKNFPGSSIPPVLNAIFHNVTCQQQQQADRHTVYEIFELVLTNYSKEVENMGLDFVYGVISAIDGERDPRNLLYIFNWIKLFLRSVKLGHLSEEMFEVLACYFPVDFKTPSSDPNRITRENLANALCPCLCAVPEFAEFCLPLALEKLDSSLKIAKLDSLDLLIEGCKNFNVESYIRHSSEIWSLIQKELMSSPDDEVATKCLKTLSSVVNKFSQAEHASFIKILNDILDTLKGNLMPDMKLFKLSSSMLLAVSSGSQKSSEYITKVIAPQLQNLLTITELPEHRVHLLKTLISFVKIFIENHKYSNIFEIEELSMIPIICLKATMDDSDDLKSVGYHSLASIVEYIPEASRTPVIDNLNFAIRNMRDSTQTSVLSCLRKLSIVYKDEIKQKIVNQEKITNEVALRNYLRAIFHIIDLSDFTETVTNISLSYALDRTNPNLSKASVECIREYIVSEPSISILDTFVQKNTISNLVACAVAEESRVFILNVSDILKILIGSQNSEVQTKIIENEMPTLESCIDNEYAYITLMSGILTRIKRDVLHNYNIVDAILNLTIKTQDNIVTNSGFQLLANLINKIDNELILEEKLQKIKTQSSHFSSSNNIILTSWITKSLLMRNHSKANCWINSLLNLISQNIDITSGLEIIMNQNCDSLSTISNCTISPLYRQKFFIVVTNRMSETFTPEKETYLNAIGCLLCYAPSQAVTMQFQKILKLVLLCIEKCTEPKILEALLSTLKRFIDNKESVIENHLEEFLLRILCLTTFENSMRVRIKALQCISSFANAFTIYKLVPLKPRVLQQLAVCVDDKKRLVRKEAMDARALWFLLDVTA